MVDRINVFACLLIINCLLVILTFIKRDSHDQYLKPQLSCAVHLYKDERKKHQAQPDNAFIIHKAVLSIKELGIKDSVALENRASRSK